MTMRRKGLFVCAALLLFSNIALAENPKNSRPATKKDLIGTWEMTAVRPVLDKNDPVFFPYQRFVFNENSSMKFISADKPFTKEWLDKFKAQAPEIDYTLNEKGALTLTWHARPHSENILCAYVLRDVPPEVAAKIPQAQRGHLPKKGNVTLSFLNSSGKIAYQKTLTRIA